MKKQLLVNSMDWINEILKNEDLELDDLLYDLSVAIIDYRIKHDLDQKELAAELKVTQAMISKYESCEYNFTIKKLYDIAEKLDMDLKVSLKPKQCKTENKFKERWANSSLKKNKKSELIA